MEAQLQEYAQRLIAAEAQMQEMQTQMGQQQQRPQAAAAPENVLPAFSAVDTRLLGKPDSFDGSQAKWRDWPIVFRSYAGALSSVLAREMPIAEKSTASCVNAVLSDESAKASNVLYFVLVMLCKGQALDLVINSGQGEGLEAWRQLCKRYEPKMRARWAGMLVNILSWNFDGDVLQRVEAFEREITMYESDSKEKVTDNIKIGILLMRLPQGSLATHMLMNADKHENWQGFRDELLNIRRAQMVTNPNGAAPMDIGALGKKGGQKGTTSLKDIVCRKCGKKGHYARDCWSGQPGGGKKGDQKGKNGKGDKWLSNAYSGGKANGNGGGKGDKNGGKGIKCHKCQGYGHIAKDCPSKKAVNGIEEGEPQSEPGAVDLGGFYINAPIDSLVLGGDICGMCFGRPKPVEEEEEKDLCMLEVSEAQLAELGVAKETIAALRGKLEKRGSTVTLGVDSGAAVSVLPPDVGADYPLEPNANSVKGVPYYAANGNPVYDMGSRVLVGKLKSNKGVVRKAVKGRVCKITKGLISAADMNDAGFKVVLDKEDSYMEDKRSGAIIPINFRRRVFELDLELEPYEEAKKILTDATVNAMASQSFPGQARP